MTPDQQVASLPRVLLAHAPTPLEAMPRLSRALGGPPLYVKRDDCTGLALGGNKARKLEYLMGEAVAAGADVVITAGAPQSNHARQTAAAAAQLGIACILVLTESVAGRSADYLRSGNLLLDRLFGADVRLLPGTANGPAEMERIATELRAQGRKPFVIPVGGSNATGGAAYVAAALELGRQLEEAGIRPAALVVPSGSGGTQAGIAMAAALAEWRFPVIGVSVSGTVEVQRRKMAAVFDGFEARFGWKRPEVIVDDGFVGPGYGQPTPAMKEAVELVARTEGLLLDPVYTGKGMAGLIAYVRAGKFDASKPVVFWHTGGAIGLTAYPEVFTT
jgi:D-cysteine desulfhydrase/L-cysteate sulfo-lyase